MVVTFDPFYLCKREPAVQGLPDNLIKPITIATLHSDRCTFNDKFHAKISSIIKTKLHRNIKRKEKLIEKLKTKYDSPSSPETFYVGKLKPFLNIASQLASEHYNSCSNVPI